MKMTSRNIAFIVVACMALFCGTILAIESATGALAVQAARNAAYSPLHYGLYGIIGGALFGLRVVLALDEPTVKKAVIAAPIGAVVLGSALYCARLYNGFDWVGSLTPLPAFLFGMVFIGSISGVCVYFAVPDRKARKY